MYDFFLSNEWYNSIWILDIEDYDADFVEEAAFDNQSDASAPSVCDVW
jgi:hypothetical protein